MTESGETSTSKADIESMERLRNGDDMALSEIMDRWQKPITSFLYRTVGNLDDARDLAQEVFVRIYRSKHRYKPTASFSSYIFTIASNLSKNHFRWQSRHKESPLPEGFESEIQQRGANGDTPAESMQRNETGEKVRRAVMELPEKLRTPLVLFHFQELSHAEIGRILSCSDKSVETRLYRARKSLKARLGEVSAL